MGLRQAGFVVLYEPRSVIRHQRGASSRSERWLNFVWARNGSLFREKWASALEEHEPAEPDSAEAIRRAVARAEAAGERRRNTKLPRPSSLSAPFDAEEQTQRLARSSRDLDRAYIADLETRLAESEADRQARLEVIERLDAALKESEADRQARLEVIERLDAALNDLRPPLSFSGLLRSRLQRTRPPAGPAGRETGGHGLRAGQQLSPPGAPGREVRAADQSALPFEPPPGGDPASAMNREQVDVTTGVEPLMGIDAGVLLDLAGDVHHVAVPDRKACDPVEGPEIRRGDDEPAARRELLP
jgi:hypothetical protein